MTTDGFILSALSKQERVVVKGLGAFTTSQHAAEIGAEGEIIAPPTAKVSFTEDLGGGDTQHFAAYVARREKCSLEEAEDRIAHFVHTLYEEIESHGTAELPGLGSMSKNDYGNLAFEMYDGTNLMPNSYGLPKLEAYPISKITPATIEKAGAPAKELNLTLWAILIPIIILAVIGGYILLNDDTYEALFGDHPVTEQLQRPSTPANNDPPVADEVDEADKKTTGPAPAEKPAAQQQAEQTTSAQKPRTEEKQEKPAAVTQQGVVSSPSNRFYIILGSFSDLERASEGRAKAIASGYANAKIVSGGGKIRLSANDFGTKDAADQEMRIVRQNHSDAWVLAY